MKLTQKQVNKKYNGVYVEINKSYDYSTSQRMYEVIKKSKYIRENMTLWQDVWTSMEYCR